MPTPRLRWVLIAYRLPRQPSTPRSALWRRLRRIGAVQIGDGLAALPDDRRTRELMDWLAEAVVEAGGDATTWVAELTSARQERELRERMCEAIAADYRDLVAEARDAQALDDARRRRAVARLRRELRRIRARDYFPTVARDEAVHAVEALSTATTVSEVAW